MNGSTDPPIGSAANRTAMLAIVTVALILRILAAVVIDRQVSGEGRQFLIEGDANGYWELGLKIAEGQEYSIYKPPRRVLRTPGFPLLLAGCVRVFGPDVFAATLVMAFVGAGGCWLTGILASTMGLRRAVLPAMTMVAISPLQIGSDVQILSESWFSFWLLICLIVLTRSLGFSVIADDCREAADNRQSTLPHNIDSQSYGNCVLSFLSGLCTGIAVLVRPGWILWAPVSGCLILCWQRDVLRRRMLSASLVVAGCFLALLPWAWRNHNVTGHWVFTSLWSGPSLYDGLHPGATGASDMRFVDEEDLFSKMSEFDANAVYKRRALEFVFSNPWRTVELAVLKAARYLSPSLNAEGFSGGILQLSSLSWYSVFSGLVVVGMWSMHRRAWLLAILAGPFLQFLLVHMVFVGSIRYRLPVELPLSVVAAVGFLKVLQACRKRDSTAGPGALDSDAA